MSNGFKQLEQFPGRPRRRRVGPGPSRILVPILVLVLEAVAGCAPTLLALPPDRFPEDSWLGAAAPMPIGEPVLDTLDVPAGDHTDWKSVQADRRGNLRVLLRVYRHQTNNQSSGHLQIMDPRKVVVLSHELIPEQEAYEIEVPVTHPGLWLIGISLRGGQVSYELRADWI